MIFLACCQKIYPKWAYFFLSILFSYCFILFFSFHWKSSNTNAQHTLLNFCFSLFLMQKVTIYSSVFLSCTNIWRSIKQEANMILFGLVRESLGNICILFSLFFLFMLNVFIHKIDSMKKQQCKSTTHFMLFIKKWLLFFFSLFTLHKYSVFWLLSRLIHISKHL